MTLGTFTKTSGNNNGYGNFTTPAVSFYSGTSYNLSLSPGFSSKSRPEYWRVWIDYNMDGDFLDAGETVYSIDAQKGDVGGTISIPAGLEGATRMRVAMKYNASPTSCEIFVFGEVEDYTLSLTIPVVVPPVADFSGNPTTVIVNNSVQFTDLSLNSPTSWSWTFNGGTPSTSSAQHPVVTYSTVGSYMVSLTVTNSAGSNTKTVNGYITVTPPGAYCTSSSTSNVIEWITQVNIGSYSNPSVASTYTYFNTPDKTVTLAPGSINNVTLTPHTTSQRNFWRIWIDFNNNGSFDDTGEQVFAANNKKGNATGTLTIPSGISGPTRMRVTMKTGGSPTSCEIFTDGEVEDYNVNITSTAAPIVQLKDLQMELYPNPASDLLNVVLTSKFEMKNIKIYNALGQILDDFDTKESQLKINLGNYPDGIYYIGVDDGHETALKKFFKE
jgi:PKD repeat protein